MTLHKAIPSARTSCMRKCVSMGKTASAQLSCVVFSGSSSSVVKYLACAAQSTQSTEHKSRKAKRRAESTEGKRRGEERAEENNSEQGSSKKALSSRPVIDWHGKPNSKSTTILRCIWSLAYAPQMRCIGGQLGLSSQVRRYKSQQQKEERAHLAFVTSAVQCMALRVGPVTSGSAGFWFTATAANVTHGFVVRWRRCRAKSRRSSGRFRSDPLQNNQWAYRQTVNTVLHRLPIQSINQSNRWKPMKQEEMKQGSNCPRDWTNKRSNEYLT